MHEDQKGFIPSRYIGENTRLISDILYDTERHNISGLLIIIDLTSNGSTRRILPSLALLSIPI
jgi:hypothetical protein